MASTLSDWVDLYSDGKAAKFWKLYIGELSERTGNYKESLINILRDKGCETILDVACGNGIDSVFLIEAGFHVISSDASTEMLKEAFQIRSERMAEIAFANWEIHRANWLTLPKDLPFLTAAPVDAILCMGNSFPHLPNFHLDQSKHKLALRNFHRLLKPGGVLVIDHRNYDAILDKRKAPDKNIYYNSKHMKSVQSSILFDDQKRPYKFVMDYELDVSNFTDDEELGHFQLSSFPFRLTQFSELINEVFGKDAKHSILADFKPLDEKSNPGFYVHVVEKSS